MYNAHMKMHNIHMKDFYEEIPLGKKKIEGRFVIPSGVRCASAAVIEKYFEIESVGIITTKSISARPKIGYKEPIFVKYGENSYINAVGLENPGAEAFREQLSKINIPDNKFLLVSLCGEDEDQFYEAARILYDYADGFELNFSCPHSKGFGLQIGNDPKLVENITKRISESFDIPVFAKLSATIPDIAHTAQIAISSGAVGITAINTIGPSIEYISEMPILFNREGGMSGSAIRPMGLKAVMDIRQMIGSEPIIIGLGGIYSKNDVDSYNRAGADFFAIGSALTNQNTEQTREYLNTMRWDLIRNRFEETYSPAPVNNMDYRRCVIEEKTRLKDNLFIIKLSRWKGYETCSDTAGKFYFLMLGEMGEKPFSLFSYNSREFVIKRVGPFTTELTKLKVGDTVFIRGPYGHDLPKYEGKTINLVGGGTGISPTYEIAKKFIKNNKVRFFFGGKDKNDLFRQEQFKELGEVIVSTEDGSLGTNGYISDVINSYEFSNNEDNVFINVGPRPMLNSVYKIERELTSDENIMVCVEYRTCCGVGICGKCATEQGSLSCVDGPFLNIRETISKDCSCSS